MPADRSAAARRRRRRRATHRAPLRARRPSADCREQERRAITAAYDAAGPRFLSLSRASALLVGARQRRRHRRRRRRRRSSARSTDMLGLLAIARARRRRPGARARGRATARSRSAPSARSRAPRSSGRAPRSRSRSRSCVVEWSARRPPLHQVLFNVGALTLASLAAAASSRSASTAASASRRDRRRRARRRRRLLRRQHGPARGRARARGPRERRGASGASASRGSLPHYVVYGFIGGVIAIAYDAVGLCALAVFAVPLLLMRKTQEAYLTHTQRSGAEAAPGGRDDPDAERLARAGEPAAQGALDRGDGVALGDGRRPRRLHRRPLAPRAAARARDRPRARALAGGARPARPRGALPRHRQARRPGRGPAEAGQPRRRGVGADAAPRGGGRAHHRPPRLPRTTPCRRSATTTSASTAPAIPTGSTGEEIPLGARIIHVADALDSMLTTRDLPGRAARSTRRSPSCAAPPAPSSARAASRALERILPLESLDGRAPRARSCSRSSSRHGRCGPCPGTALGTS